MNEEFNDPRLAVIYDAVNPWGAAEEFYISLPDSTGDSILDLGCGTGRLACAYAREGHEVAGADPAAAMLAVARSREWGDRVHWVHSDAQSFQSERRFDLIVMTNHAFQFLHSDQDIQAALASMKRHLAAGGRAAFETRNPLARAWEAWDLDESYTVDRKSAGMVDVWSTVDEVNDQFVQFKMHYLFQRTGERLSSTNMLRLLSRPGLESRLTRAGLHLEHLYGNWDGSPFSAKSPEMIVVAGT